jgi:hypothetical protein
MGEPPTGLVTWSALLAGPGDPFPLRLTRPFFLPVGESPMGSSPMGHL